MRRGVIGWGLVGAQAVLLVVLVLLPWRSPTVMSLALGGAVIVAGTILLLAAFRTLGRALTPTPVPIPGAGLRTDGLYRVVRHPIYSAVLLLVLGFLVAVGSGWSWAWGAVILVFFVAKSRWEDHLLREEYGPEWSAWAVRTGAIVPRLGRSS